MFSTFVFDAAGATGAGVGDGDCVGADVAVGDVVAVLVGDGVAVGEVVGVLDDRGADVGLDDELGFEDDFGLLVKAGLGVIVASGILVAIPATSFVSVEGLLVSACVLTIFIDTIIRPTINKVSISFLYLKIPIRRFNKFFINTVLYMLWV